MIDEFAYISFQGHIVVFSTFLETNLPSIHFLGLLLMEDGKKGLKDDT